jgi:hypothetical protein
MLNPGSQFRRNNMFIYEDAGGSYLLNNADELLKGLGVIKQSGRPILMTDESGELVGAGFNGQSLLKSMETVASLKTMRVQHSKPRMLKKSRGAEAREVDMLFKSVNALGDRSGWDELNNKLDALLACSC